MIIRTDFISPEAFKENPCPALISPGLRQADLDLAKRQSQGLNPKWLSRVEG